MADIFLSYAAADRALIERLAAELQARGLSVWWDADIYSGDEFSRRIQAALDEAKVAVVAWSKTAVDSRWVRDEADYALQQAKLASVTLDGTVPPLGFRQFQCTDISRFAAQGASALAPLIEALAHRLDVAPTPVVVPATTGANPGALRAGAGKALAGAAAVAVVLAAVAYFVTRAPPGDERSAAPGPAVQAMSPPAQATRKAVAVLPFLAMSASAEDGYFADGLTEEILNSLAAVPALLVTARTSSFYFKGKDLPIPEIAAKLGVDYVLEGSLRPAGNGMVRITAQLIRAFDGTHLWSEKYDRATKDILGVQTEIAQKVAGALGVLLDEKTRRFMDAQNVESVAAFAAYQRGAALFYEAHAYGPFLPKLTEAQVELASALAIEPDFAEARLMHAVIYSRYFDRRRYGMPAGDPYAKSPPEQLRRLFIEDLDEALRHARTPHRRVMIDFVRTLSADDWTGLAVKLDAALTGTECLGNFGWIGKAPLFGRLDAAIALMERRKACDPFDPAAYGTIINLYLQKGDFGAVRANIAKGRELFGPRPPYDSSEFELALAERDFAAARAIIPRLRDPEQAALFLALAEGDPAAVELRKRFEAQLSPGEPVNARAADLLTLAAWSGERDEAARLARQIDSGPFGTEFLMDAALECECGSPFPLEATPHFARRLEQAGLDWAPTSPIRWPAKNW